ncbi:MAG: NAD-dependent epimerase/dehydratase family protein [Planctomycetes bacterium]|nr:NAD-dependent epimerase/dehydratase family protein [Planctomycetota bacterium]
MEKNLRADSSNKAFVLVTGASGFLGGRLSEQLVSQGFRLRAFVRKSSKTAKLEALCADIHYGDVNDYDSLEAAMQGVDVIVHAAADTSGNAQGAQASTIAGTRNVVKVASARGVQQLIYISTCNVYGTADCHPGSQLDESGPMERHPEKRGGYSYAKFIAEEVVRDAMNKGGINITCLRPGTIWGPGGETYTPMMGFRAGNKIFGIIGSGDFILPLVYIDNLVSAILNSIGNESAYNQIFNVVDAHQVNKAHYVDMVLKQLHPGAFVFNIPYWLIYSAVWGQEILCRLLRRSPFLTCYRLTSSQRPIVYHSDRIRDALGWKAPVGFEAAAKEVIRYAQGV